MKKAKSKTTVKKAAKKPQTISEYIKAAPKDSQAKLKQLRACIRAAAPKATESLKWGVPAFSYHRILVTFAAFKKHIGFYPTPSVLRAFKDELSAYKTGKGSVQFPLEKSLPLSLIRKMTKHRVHESLVTDEKWK